MRQKRPMTGCAKILKPADFDAYGDLGLTPVAMPRVMTSRNLDKQSADIQVVSKRKVKIATVEWL